MGFVKVRVIGRKNILWNYTNYNWKFMHMFFFTGGLVNEEIFIWDFQKENVIFIAVTNLFF